MAGKDQTAREKVEYTELCKTIRKIMRQDIREHNTMGIKEAIESDILNINKVKFIMKS